jgi:hypothetical protein
MVGMGTTYPGWLRRGALGARGLLHEQPRRDSESTAKTPNSGGGVAGGHATDLALVSSTWRAWYTLAKVPWASRRPSS